jgi:hypothetical protein
MLLDITLAQHSIKYLLAFFQGIAYLVNQIPFYFIEIKEPVHRTISMPQFYPGVSQQILNRVLC